MSFTLPLNWRSPYRLTDVGRRRDGLSYAVERLGLKPSDSLTLYHQTHRSEWQGSHAPVHITPAHSRLGALGPGFYTSTIPATGYGPNLLTLELPVAALEEVPVLELPPRAMDTLWSLIGREDTVDGVDIIAAPAPTTYDEQKGATWLAFTPQSEDWLNASLTRAEF